MPQDPDVPLGALLALPLILLVPALVATLAMQKRARATIGAEIAGRRPGVWGRRALLAGPQAAVLALVLMHGDLSEGPSAEILFLGILLAWLSPGQGDAVLGETGVQRGWIGLRFEHLEAWRLAGDQLRFKLHGEWTFVPCPFSEQPRVDEILRAVNAEGEIRPDASRAS